MRISAKSLAGAVAMLTLGASVVLSQDSTRTRPTSTRRIPITKEGGEVARKVDTVTVYKTDTLRVNVNTPPTIVHDTVTRTVTRVDTVTTTYYPPVRLPGGLYFGLNGGVNAPNGAIYNPNGAGPTVGAQFGWQGAKNLLGIRTDLNWSTLGEDSRFSQPQGDPDIWNWSIDAKLQIPWLTHTFGAIHRFSLYGIGGYTHTWFKNLPMRVDASDPNAVVFVQGVPDWTNQNGWNAGGGASLMWGRSELFFETRVLAFKPDNAPQSRQMPFVLGMNWYGSR
ncbi:MAG TPA: hypothetical protein VGP95_03910 [Gemmatimonadaceae bacterium]|nr:hypothetical protein [Gemmatimonadaceae bacterium]